jgi:putative ABC transport system permease protein
MTRAALKSLLSRKLRTVLTALAIVLGVSMVSGSFVLTDSISKAFDSILASSYDETDAVVSGKAATKWQQGSKLLVSEELLTRVRAVPEVAAAAGTIFDFNSSANSASLLDKQGKVITGDGPSFGVGVDSKYPQFNPMKLVSGQWATGPNEVVIDASVASRHDFAVGDSIRIAVGGPVRSFHVAGVAKFGDIDSMGGATFAIFDVKTAQQLLGKSGFDAISVAAKSGVSSDELVDRLREIVPADTTSVYTGAEQAEKDGQGIDMFLGIFKKVLIGFGGIALFVGGFVIFNTLSITVAQRTRELATMRTLGASRRQVMRLVVLESLVTGLIASAIGFVAGLGIAKGLVALLSAAGAGLPRAETVIASRTVLVSIAAGTIVTVIAGIVPAIRATRVAPIAAVREGATAEQKHRSPIWAAVVLAVAAASTGYGLFAPGVPLLQRVVPIVFGTLVLFVGAAMAAGTLVKPLVAVITLVTVRLGGTSGRLARENALRNPGRTASTAAALMIGLALVTFVGVLANGLNTSAKSAVTKQLASDYVVTGQEQWTAMPLQIGRAVGKAPGVSTSSSVRYDRGLLNKDELDVFGVDAKTIGGVYDFSWKSGSSSTIASLGSDGAVVEARIAKEKGLTVGSTFTLTSVSSRKVELTVKGIYAPPRLDPLLGAVIVDRAVFDRVYETPADVFTLVNADASKAELEQALAAYPDARVLTASEFVTDRTKDLTDILSMLYALLGLSVIVSLFGMVNTLVLSVFERTREIGMLRAIGFTRRQTRRMIRHESIVTALIGAALGLPLGVGLAAAVAQALGKYGVGFSVPVGSLIAFTGVAIVAGTLAAILPARRAARLNVLEALQYE